MDELRSAWIALLNANILLGADGDVCLGFLCACVSRVINCTSIVRGSLIGFCEE